MKVHLVTSDTPLEGKYAKSVCEKDCEILRHIPTDADLQDFDMRSLTSCKKCTGARLRTYVYAARLTPTDGVDERKESK